MCVRQGGGMWLVAGRKASDQEGRYARIGWDRVGDDAEAAAGTAHSTSSRTHHELKKKDNYGPGREICVNLMVHGPKMPRTYDGLLILIKHHQSTAEYWGVLETVQCTEEQHQTPSANEVPLAATYASRHRRSSLRYRGCSRLARACAGW